MVKCINDIESVKNCSNVKCLEVNPQPLDNFYTQKKFNKKHGHHYYRSTQCKNCSIDRARKNNLKKHDEYVTYLREWREINKDAANRQKREEYYPKVREQRKKYNKEYRNSEHGKEKFREYGRNRLESKKHEISNKEWIACKKYFNNSCAYCGLHIEEHYIIYADKPKKTDLHKEHVEHDGSNKLDNCIPSCWKCNVSKHQNDLIKWYNETNPKFSKERLEKISRWLDIDHKIYLEHH